MGGGEEMDDEDHYRCDERCGMMDEGLERLIVHRQTEFDRACTTFTPCRDLQLHPRTVLQPQSSSETRVA